MTGIITYQTEFGPISIEVAEFVAQQAGDDGAIAKGVIAKGAGDEVVALAVTTFDDAMGSFRAWSAKMCETMVNLPIKPEEVCMEVGLKMTASAGFIIAKAGGEAEVKISLTWKPRQAAAPASEPRV